MKTNFFKDGKLPGKGTAAVICFCLAAVAALGIFSYNRSAKGLADELSGLAENKTATQPVIPPEDSENAAAPAENVPLETEPDNGSSGDSGNALKADTPAENIPIETMAQDPFGSTNGNDSPDIVPAEADSIPGATAKPVSGEIINSFSGGELVRSKTLSVWKTHDGIDVSADEGTAVRSMTSGVVTDVTDDPLMGVTVVIDHGSGYEGWYCSLASEVPVSEGDEVESGTVIGEVGTTAEAEIADPPHLHFGLKKNNAWVDPAEYLSGEGS
ncbi:MAG: M23 family metallopeptidase [Ruminococcus sp.]|nr:M23 family metallopeptidase [Ruminococcus sp.]